MSTSNYIPTQASSTDKDGLPLTAPSIRVTNLSYTFPDGTPGLKDASLYLPPRSRTLLIGANGAGKTTLLRLLSGKRLSRPGTILVGNVDPFAFGLTGVTYLGLEWVLNPVVRADMDVWTLLKSVGGDHYPDRRNELVDILDVDVFWRMHVISDGERRRVQLVMGLLRPWSVLLLDEVTVDLDVYARWRFLEFLKRETERRECTVVYATHVMDGMVGWPTHVVRMAWGRVKECLEFEEVPGLLRRYWERGIQRAKGGSEIDVSGRQREGRLSGEEGPVMRNSVLLELVLRWLEEDMRERRPRQNQPDGREVRY